MASLMADNDDRKIPLITSGTDSISLQSLNETIRQLYMNVYKLEGRLGEATVRDDLRVLGKQTWVGQDAQVGESGSGVIYYDAALAKFMASQNGGTMQDLLPLIPTPTNVYHKTLYVDSAAHGNAAGAGETTLSTYTLPGGTIATTGKFLRIHAHGLSVGTANSKTYRLYAGVNAAFFVNTDVGSQLWYMDAILGTRFNGLWYHFGSTMTMLNRDAGGTANMATDNTAGSGGDNLASNMVVKTTGAGTAANDWRQDFFSIELISDTPL